jgi:hypothetical protein
MLNPVASDADISKAPTKSMTSDQGKSAKPLRIGTITRSLPVGHVIIPRSTVGIWLFVQEIANIILLIGGRALQCSFLLPLFKG